MRAIKEILNECPDVDSFEASALWEERRRVYEYLRNLYMESVRNCTEAQLEARIDELQKLEQAGTNTFRARVRYVYTEQRLAELNSIRQETKEGE